MRARSPFVAVVDDEPKFRQALSRLLRTHGFEVLDFADGRQLMAAAAHPEYDCVLLDLHMPGVSGWELLAALGGPNPRRPVIVMTGHDAPGDATRARRLGAAGYLLKPLDEVALLDALQQAMLLTAPERFEPYAPAPGGQQGTTAPDPANPRHHCKAT